MHHTATLQPVLHAVLLRPATAADESLLLRLEALLSGHLRNGRGLSGEMARSLAQLILRGREAAWRATWPKAQCLVIECDGKAIGRLWVDTSSGPWQLLDLALLPSHRGQGLAQAALRAWLRQADAAGAAVRTRVARNDPFLLRLRCLDFLADGQQRGQVWLQRAPVASAACDWNEPTLELAA